MKIELRKIEYSARLSEETNAFAADLYIDGKKAGVASNQGHGGPTDYHATSGEGGKLIAAAEQYCKGLPAEKFVSGGKEYSFNMDLETFIDRLVDNHLEAREQQKFQRKIDKATINGIVYGKANSHYKTLAFKLPISTILRSPNGPERLAETIRSKVIQDMKSGEQVLNRNIPQKILQEAGLKEGQYLSECHPAIRETVQNRKGKGI